MPPTSATILLPELAKTDPRIETFKLDVLKTDDIAAAVRRTGPLDIIFNCSGFVHAGTILDCDDKSWDFSFDLNVKAHFHMIKAYLPSMLEARQGLDRQHVVGRLLDQRRAQPLRLWLRPRPPSSA